MSSFWRYFYHWMHQKLLMTTSGAASVEKFVKMMTFPFQWRGPWCEVICMLWNKLYTCNVDVCDLSMNAHNISHEICIRLCGVFLSCDPIGSIQVIYWHSSVFLTHWHGDNWDCCDISELYGQNQTVPNHNRTKQGANCIHISWDVL